MQTGPALPLQGRAIRPVTATRGLLQGPAITVEPLAGQVHRVPHVPILLRDQLQVQLQDPAAATGHRPAVPADQAAATGRRPAVPAGPAAATDLLVRAAGHPDLQSADHQAQDQDPPLPGPAVLHPVEADHPAPDQDLQVEENNN